jgi:hypothetical protein
MAARALEGADRGAFLAWWQDCEMRLAMLAHQRSNGAAGPERIAQVRAGRLASGLFTRGVVRTFVL